jgi:hypothetical protein
MELRPTSLEGLAASLADVDDFLRLNVYGAGRIREVRKDIYAGLVRAAYL